MPNLVFNVEANYQEVIRLTEEIDKLKAQLKKASSSTDPLKIKEWKADLADAQTKLAEFITTAAAGGAKMEQFIKKANAADIAESYKVAADSFKNNPALILTSQFDSTKKQIKELEKAIKDYEHEIEEVQGHLAESQKESIEAMVNGDEQAFETAGKEIQAEVATIQKLNNEREECVKVLKLLKGEEEEENEEKEKSAGVLDKLTGSNSNYRKIITLLPAPMKRVLNGINNITKASLKFIATPIGAVVAAIALAFASLKKYLTGTEEGEMRLARATGYLKGVLIPIENLAARVGKAIYDAFSHPRQVIDQFKTKLDEVNEKFGGLKGILQDIGTHLKDDILGHISTLLSGFKAIGQLFEDKKSGVTWADAFKTFRETLAETEDGKKLKNLATGAKSLANGVKETVSNVVRDMNASGKAMADIQAARLQLEKDESAWNASKASNGARKDELQSIFQNTSLDNKWRQQALDEYMKIIEEEQKGDLGILGRKVSLISRENALYSSNTSAQKSAYNSAAAEYSGAKAQYESTLTDLMNTRQSIINDALEEEEQMRQLNFEGWVRSIESMDEGVNKELELLLADYQRAVDEVQQLEKQWKQNQGAMLSDATKDVIRSLNPDVSDEELFGNLSEEQIQVLKDMLEQAKVTLFNGRKALGEAVYDQFKSNEDKMKDLDKEYLDDMLALQTAYNTTGDEKFKRSMEVRTREYQSSLLEIEKVTDSTMKLIFADIDQMTKGVLDEAIIAAQEKLESLIKKGADVADIASIRSRLDELQNARDSYDFTGWGGSVTDLLMMESKKDRLNAGKKRDEALLQSAVVGSEQYKELTDSINNADRALGKLDEDEKKALTTLLASRLGEELAGIGESLMEIGDDTNDEKLQRLGETLAGLGNTVSSVAQGFAQGGVVGGVFALVGDMVSKMTSTIIESIEAQARARKAADDYAYSLRLLALQVKETENAFGSDTYGNAVRAWEKAKDALEEYRIAEGRIMSDILRSQGIPIELGNARKQIEELGFLLENGELDIAKVEEYFKANSGNDWLDEEHLKRLNDFKQSYDDLKKAASEFTSYLVGNAANDIASKMVDNFIKTGSAIVDMTDNMAEFKKKMAESYAESILMQKVFTDENEALITNALMEGRWDDAVVAYNDLMDKANAEAQGIQEWLSRLNIQDWQGQDATAGGFQTMSQDTGTELNGRFTALQISGEHIDENTALVATMFKEFALRYATSTIALDDIRNIQAQSLLELQSINENTFNALKPIRTMNDTIEEIRKKVDRL